MFTYFGSSCNGPGTIAAQHVKPCGSLSGWWRGLSPVLLKFQFQQRLSGENQQSPRVELWFQENYLGPGCETDQDHVDRKSVV